jgi:hypothetical protein
MSVHVECCPGTCSGGPGPGMCLPGPALPRWSKGSRHVSPGPVPCRWSASQAAALVQAAQVAHVQAAGLVSSGIAQVRVRVQVSGPRMCSSGPRPVAVLCVQACGSQVSASMCRTSTWLQCPGPGLQLSGPVLAVVQVNQGPGMVSGPVHVSVWSMSSNGSGPGMAQAVLMSRHGLRSGARGLKPRPGMSSVQACGSRSKGPACGSGQARSLCVQGSRRGLSLRMCSRQSASVQAQVQHVAPGPRSRWLAQVQARGSGGPCPGMCSGPCAQAVHVQVAARPGPCTCLRPCMLR